MSEKGNGGMPLQAQERGIPPMPEGNEYPAAISHEVASHFDEKGLAAIILMIATTNLFNRLNATIKEPAGAAWN
jgi:hypothetical protein